jgi:uncharacterized protein (DUF1697 family)
MPTYVAFLRAIYHMKMDRLRRPFEVMEFSNVDTFLASGNIIFEATSPDTDALEREIDDALNETIDRETATFIRSTDELTEIAHHRPFEDADLNADGHTLYIAFLGTTPGDEVQQNLLSFTSDVDAFHIDGREVYWLCRTKQSQNPRSPGPCSKRHSTCQQLCETHEPSRGLLLNMREYV